MEEEFFILYVCPYACFKKDMIGTFFLFYVSVCHFYSVCPYGGVAVCHASNRHGRNILLILCVRVAVWRCVMLQKDMVEIFFLFCVSVWRCVMLQKTMVGIVFSFCVSVWWCGGVAVCHASKGHGRNIILILCVLVAVWWCGGVTMCHALKGRGINILLILCVRVAVCHASKGHGRNIILILCVHVAVWQCGGVAVCHASKGHGRNILLILCPCGGVSCFKRP